MSRTDRKALRTAPEGFVTQTDLLQRFGWRISGLALKHPDAFEKVRAARVDVIVDAHRVYYVPEHLNVPLHPRLHRAAQRPAAARAVDPITDGPRQGLTRQRYLCLRTSQAGGDCWQVSLPAERLYQSHRIVRMHGNQNGTNRLFDEARAIEIAQAMIEGVRFPDNIVVHVKDLDVARHGRDITLHEDSVLEIIDGQHRTAALGLLSAQERAGLSLPVVVYTGLSSREKKEVFFAQTLRKPIAPQVRLRLHADLKRFRSDRDKMAYDVAKALGQQEDSPLAGLVNFEEHAFAVTRDGRPSRSRVSLPAGRCDVVSVWSMLKRLVNKRSPLRDLEGEDLLRIVLDTLKAAKATWPSSWADPQNPLRTVAGIEALLSLHNEALFAGCMDRRISTAAINRTIAAGRRFRWNSKNVKDALREASGGRNRNRATEMLARNIHRNMNR